MTIQEILKKYPIRNLAWDYFPESNAFVIELSELKDVCTDPWNRKLITSQLKAQVRNDVDQEITHYIASTTVEGIPIALTILND